MRKIITFYLRYSGLFHSVDLVPTILAAANISRGPSKMVGTPTPYD